MAGRRVLEGRRRVCTGRCTCWSSYSDVLGLEGLVLGPVIGLEVVVLDWSLYSDVIDLEGLVLGPVLDLECVVHVKELSLIHISEPTRPY